MEELSLCALHAAERLKSQQGDTQRGRGGKRRRRRSRSSSRSSSHSDSDERAGGEMPPEERQRAATGSTAAAQFSTKIFAKADAAGRDSGSDAGDAGDGEWQSADGASEGEASGAETEGEEAEGEETEGETGPPLWAEYDALDDLSYQELWAAHQQEFPHFCFWHVCGGCSRGSACRFEHGSWPEGYQDMCYSVTGVWP